MNEDESDDKEECLEPEDLTDEELGVDRPLDPWVVAATRRRARRRRERWQYLSDDPLPAAVTLGPTTLPALLRAVRRIGRWNQRELAAAAGVSASWVAHTEAPGGADPRLSVLLRVTGAVGLRLVVVDDEDTHLAELATATDEYVDGGGRRLPAHLDTYDPRRYRTQRIGPLPRVSAGRPRPRRQRVDAPPAGEGQDS